MPNRSDVVTEARSWVGTPYHHQQWRKGAGCDCIGLVLGTIRGLGLPAPSDSQMPNYGQFPSDHVAERTASVYMDVVGSGWEDVIPGRVGLFYWRERGHGQHFCIFGEIEGRLTMIQAYFGSGKVIETSLPAFWKPRLMRVFDLKGIDK